MELFFMLWHVPWEISRVPVLLTVGWLLLACLVAFAGRNQAATASLLNLVAVAGPLIWSIPSMWFIGLPVVFLFGITGFIAKVAGRSRISRSVGNGLLLGVGLGLLCRGVISIASGK